MITEKEFEDEAVAREYRTQPLMLLDPTRRVEDEKHFRYSIGVIPKSATLLADQRRAQKEKKNLSTQSGMPLFSSLDIYGHYLDEKSWSRACQLPTILTYIERMSYIRSQVDVVSGVNCLSAELALWATSTTNI